MSGMPRKPRTWEPYDYQLANYFNHCRQQEKPPKPIRTIEQTTGISRNRLWQIFNAEGGPLAVNEFIKLCRFFNLNPKIVLDSIDLSQTNADKTD